MISLMLLIVISWFFCSWIAAAIIYAYGRHTYKYAFDRKMSYIEAFYQTILLGPIGLISAFFIYDFAKCGMRFFPYTEEEMKEPMKNPMFKEYNK